MYQSKEKRITIWKTLKYFEKNKIHSLHKLTKTEFNGRKIQFHEKNYDKREKGTSGRPDSLCADILRTKKE